MPSPFSTYSTRRRRRAVVAVVDLAVAVDDLRMLDEHARSRRAAHREGDIPGRVLAEVVDRPAVAVGPALPRRERRQFPDRPALLRHEEARVELQHLDARGRRRILEPGVVDLAEVDARPQDRQRAALPCAVGPQQHLVARGDLGQCADPVAPAIEDRLVPPHDLRAVPAVREPDLDPVRARPQQRGDRVGLEGDALVVAGPARGQQVVADPPAIDEGAVDARAPRCAGTRRRARRRGRTRARRSSPACPRPGRRGGGSCPPSNGAAAAGTVPAHSPGPAAPSLSPCRSALRGPGVSVYNDLRRPLYPAA